jgi:hypothetical protein
MKEYNSSFYFDMTVPALKEDWFIMAHYIVPNPGLSSNLTFSFVVLARHPYNFIMATNPR